MKGCKLEWYVPPPKIDPGDIAIVTRVVNETLLGKRSVTVDQMTRAMSNDRRNYWLAKLLLRANASHDKTVRFGGSVAFGEFGGCVSGARGG